MFRALLKNKQAVVGLSIIFVVGFMAIFANWIAPNDPNLVNVSQKYLEPSYEYPLGTDQMGRCEMSRLIYGARYSLGISLPALLGLSLVGLIIGTVSASSNKVVDNVITILCDVFIGFPPLIITAVIVGIFGTSINNLIIAIILGMWAFFVRMVRSYAKVERQKDYIIASRIRGCNKFQIIVNHIIPNIMPQYLVLLTTSIAGSILTISGFAFLGLGLPSGTSEWGAMLSDAKINLYSHSELILYPGLAILLTVSGFNLFGEALRDEISKERGE